MNLDIIFLIFDKLLINSNINCLGQALVTLGCFLDSKMTIYAGRFVFGLGGENLAVACNTYASSWFTGSALNMAFGFQLAVVRVGSAISLQILGPIYEAFLPDECTYVPTTTMEPDAATVPSIALATSQSTTNTTIGPYDCEKEENLAMGWTMTVACSSVVLSMVGSFVAAMLDKIRSKYNAGKVEEQPQVENDCLRITSLLMENYISLLVNC